MKKSVCFTGHRTIDGDREKLSARLYALLERLVTEKKGHRLLHGRSCWVGRSRSPDRSEIA